MLSSTFYKIEPGLLGKRYSYRNLFIIIFLASWVRRAMIQPILFLPMHKTSMLRFCGTHLPLLTARLSWCQTREHNQSLSYSNEQRTESQNC